MKRNREVQRALSLNSMSSVNHVLRSRALLCIPSQYTSAPRSWEGSVLWVMVVGRLVFEDTQEAIRWAAGDVPEDEL